MGSKLKWIGAAAMAGILLCGCSNTTSDKPVVPGETTTDIDDATIFDKIINGEQINDTGSLYDCTGTFSMEGYSIVASGYYGEKYILVLYAGEKDSKVVAYQLSDGKEYKTISFDDIVFSKDAYIGYTGDGLTYVYDSDNSCFYYLHVKEKKYDLVTIDFNPKSMIVIDGGETILYTVENDCNIYEFIKETANSVSVYDASGETDDVVLKYIEADSDTLIVKTTSKEYTGYSSISMEMQEMSPIELTGDDLYYTGQEYIYTSATQPKNLAVYNVLRPRVYQIFMLEDRKEKDNLVVFSNGPKVLSMVDEDDATMLRFYNISAGIMENYVSVDGKYTINRISLMSEANNLFIETTDSNGDYHILIWDITDVSEVIS